MARIKYSKAEKFATHTPNYFRAPLLIKCSERHILI